MPTRVASDYVENRVRGYFKERKGSQSEDNRIRNSRLGRLVPDSLSYFLVVPRRPPLPPYTHPMSVHLQPLSFRRFLRLGFPPSVRFLRPPSTRNISVGGWTRRNEGITSNYKKLSADQIRYAGVLITTPDQLETKRPSDSFPE